LNVILSGVEVIDVSIRL